MKQLPTGTGFTTGSNFTTKVHSCCSRRQDQVRSLFDAFGISTFWLVNCKCKPSIGYHSITKIHVRGIKFNRGSDQWYCWMVVSGYCWLKIVVKLSFFSTRFKWRGYLTINRLILRPNFVIRLRIQPIMHPTPNTQTPLVMKLDQAWVNLWRIGVASPWTVEGRNSNTHIVDQNWSLNREIGNCSADQSLT